MAQFSLTTVEPTGVGSGWPSGLLLVPAELVSAQATFIHASVRFEFGALRWLVATPQFHHWHHAAEHDAVDKNFAVLLPLFDILLGTAHLPDRRPSAYGLVGGATAPPGCLRLFLWPFRARRRPE